MAPVRLLNIGSKTSINCNVGNEILNVQKHFKSTNAEQQVFSGNE